tara:strand:+ start:441 stop:635 length:195 start_codon:yes stop_codon:yes gene_type:complete
MSKRVKITESELVDLIDKIVSETVSEKKKQWIAEQKVSKQSILEGKINQLEAKVRSMAKTKSKK